MELKTKQREKKEWLPVFSSAGDLQGRARPESVDPVGDSRATSDGYYGIPLLKRPTWGWEIALYFFFEGISAGSFLLSSLAEVMPGNRFRRLRRAGYTIAFLAFLPCPPLLIADLGRPERFLHMLRVFKPQSPMSVGAWTLSFFSIPLTLLGLKELGGKRLAGFLGRGSRFLPRRLLTPVLAIGGIPFALTMIAYPGVLLSTTSIPVWSRSRFLGALFSCSSINTAAAALSLGLNMGRRGQAAPNTLGRLETVATLTEGTAMAAYVGTLGETAKPLTSGRYKVHFWAGAVGAGLLLPFLLTPLSHRRSRTGRAAAFLRSTLSLAGGLALKWAVTYAGKESADDIRSTHIASRPDKSATGWPGGSLESSAKAADAEEGP